jgi:Holliday junction resolvasome RuvABC endonuclease subunit
MGVVSAFTFGCNYERVVMALMCAGIPVEEVTPQRWQKALGCLTHGDKKVSKARAQQLFPGIKITNYIADALLIAEYGRRISL